MIPGHSLQKETLQKEKELQEHASVATNLYLRLLTAPSALLNFSLCTLTSNQCQVGRNLFCGS